MGRSDLALELMATKHRGLRMRVLRVLVLAAIVMGVGWVPAARAEGLKSISVEEFQAELERLQGVVTACGAGACDADVVGDDVLVGDEAKGGFEEHWAWLRDTLDKAKSAKAEERAALLADAGTKLEEMGRESSAKAEGATGGGDAREFARARSKANEVLSRGEFQAGGGPTWWDRLKSRMLGWVQRFFMGVARVGVAAPWLGTLLEWMCFVGAGVGLLFFLLRNVARQRLRVALGNSAVQASAWDREADDWATWAEQHATAGEWREAVHCLYWAAIVSLESRRAWRHNPTRTPREYVRLLKPGSAQEKGLRRLTQIFERVWYGLRDANAEEYAEARTQYERLSGAGVASDSKPAEALSAGGTA